MNGFVPNDQHMHEVLILLYNMKKSATEAYEEIKATYGSKCIQEATCREKFALFAKGDYTFKEADRLKVNKRSKKA